MVRVLSAVRLDVSCFENILDGAARDRATAAVGTEDLSSEPCLASTTDKSGQNTLSAISLIVGIERLDSCFYFSKFILLARIEVVEIAGPRKSQL